MDDCRREPTLAEIMESLHDLHRKADTIMAVLDDINAALTALSGEVTTFLADVSAQISGGLTAAEAEAVVAQINGFTTQLKAADPAPAPAAPAAPAG